MSEQMRSIPESGAAIPVDVFQANFKQLFSIIVLLIYSLMLHIYNNR